MSKNKPSYKELIQNLNFKQRLFVEFYKGNATNAAKEAGYKNSCNRALRTQGARLLANDNIKAAIAARPNGNGQRKRVILSVEAVQSIWCEIAQDADVQVRDRLKALELYARSQAMFTDNIKVSGTIKHLSDDQLQVRLDAALYVLGIEMPEFKQLCHKPASNVIDTTAEVVEPTT